jgi:hypothetical protein
MMMMILQKEKKSETDSYIDTYIIYDFAKGKRMCTRKEV